MLKTLVVVLTLSLAGCGLFKDKVHAIVDNEFFTATFLEKECDNKAILDRLPVEQVKELKGQLKAGKVHFKKKDEDRQFCYVILGASDEAEMAAIIDEQGNTPLIAIKK